MLTGIGLATGFAIINGIPHMTNEWAEARIDGEQKPSWRHITPQWMLNLIDGTTAVDFGSPQAKPEMVGSP